MSFGMRRNFQRFLAFLTILSVTFTQTCPVWALREERNQTDEWMGTGESYRWCVVFGCSWRQTMNAMTNPNKARAAAGRSPASSFISFSPPFSFQSSGVIQVPTDAKTSITATVAKNNFQLPRPVTHWPISAIEIRNSADRPNIDATYFRFALLSFTTQAYHLNCLEAIRK